MIDFPSNPTIGQLYPPGDAHEEGTKQWKWNGFGWDLQMHSSAEVAEIAELSSRAQASEQGAAQYAQSAQQSVSDAAGFKNAAEQAAQTAGQNATAAQQALTSTQAIEAALRIKLQEQVSVKDKGAIGNGVVDDTSAIDAAQAATGAPYFPDGIYAFTGDMDALFSKPLAGAGAVRFGGFDYPVARDAERNALWAGGFQCWAMGHALNVGTVQRVQIPAGVTHARNNFSSGTTVSHVEGDIVEDAMRIQRVAGTNGVDSHVAVLALTQEETRPLVGRRCVVQINAKKGADYSGASVTLRVQYSAEQAQTILNADGTYTSGHVTLLTQALPVTLTKRQGSAPMFYAFDLPADACQVSVALVVPFAGVAGADDFIEVEALSMHVGKRPARILWEVFAESLIKARGRYRSSLPYGAPRGTNTEQGAVSARAINTAISGAFEIYVPFDPPMDGVPAFYFQSPTSGTGSRLLNKNSGANINGLAHSITDSGATITNNAAAVAGDRYLCQWTAECLV